MRILVSTDGSERSFHALGHAEVLVRAFGGEVQLLRVVMHASAFETDTAVTEQRDYLMRMLEERRIPGHAFAEVHREDEDVAGCIVRVADWAASHLIAMDTRGSDALRHALFGSIAMDVFANADRPLMVTGPAIGAPVKSSPYHLLMTVDGSEDAEAVVPAIAALTAGHQAKVTILHVVHSSEAAESPGATDHLKPLVGAFGDAQETQLLVRATRIYGSVAETIVKTAVKCGASAIAMASHGKSRAHHLLAGSTAMSVVKHSPLPVILVQSPRPEE